MNSQNTKIIQEMYVLASKRYSVPDKSDFEVILDYYCSIFLKVYEQDISDPKQADLMSELYASSEEFLMTQFSRECRYARDFEELERKHQYKFLKRRNELDKKGLGGFNG